MTDTVLSRYRGEFFTFLLSLIEAFFPIFSFFTVTALGALHAYFYSIVVASILLVFWLVLRGKLYQLKRTEAYPALFFTSLYITTLFCLVFLALKYTTPGHVAIILFLQVLFSYLFLGRRTEERLSKHHLFGVALMTLGALIVLFPHKIQFNLGDLLVLLAAMIAPIANLYQKRARQFVSSEVILATRTIIALPVVYLFAANFEATPSWQEIKDNAHWLLLTGGLVFVVSKILWVEALYLLPITKVNAFYAFSPLLTLWLAYLILNEAPSWSQIAGALPILVGSYFLTRKPAQAV